MNNKYILFACALLAAQSLQMYAPLEFEEREPIEPVKPVESPYETEATRAKKAATAEEYSSYTDKPTVRTSRGSTASTIEYGATPSRSSHGVALSEDGSPAESSLSVGRSKTFVEPYSPSADGAFSDAAAAQDAADSAASTPSQRRQPDVSPHYKPLAESVNSEFSFETPAPEEAIAPAELPVPAPRKFKPIPAKPLSPLAKAQTEYDAASAALRNHIRTYGERIVDENGRTDYSREGNALRDQRNQLQEAFSKAVAKVKALQAAQPIREFKSPSPAGAFDDAANAADALRLKAPAPEELPVPTPARKRGMKITSSQPQTPEMVLQAKYSAATNELSQATNALKEYQRANVDNTGIYDYSPDGNAIRAKVKDLQAAVTKASAKVKALRDAAPKQTQRSSRLPQVSAFDAAFDS